MRISAERRDELLPDAAPSSPGGGRLLQQRGIDQPQVIEELKIGYAPGLCLSHGLKALGYLLCDLQQAGLVNADGLDTFSHRVVSLWRRTYMAVVLGRPRHTFPARRQRRTLCWDLVKHCPKSFS